MLHALRRLWRNWRMLFWLRVRAVTGLSFVFISNTNLREKPPNTSCQTGFCSVLLAAAVFPAKLWLTETCLVACAVSRFGLNKALWESLRAEHVKNITRFPHCQGNTHISVDTKPTKVLVSRPPFSSFGETTILFALSLPFCHSILTRAYTERTWGIQSHIRRVQRHMCTVCKGGRSMLWVEHLCTSKLYKRLWASSLQMKAARSQRQPHTCLQQETSFLFTADMFLCSTCTMQWSFKKGPYPRGLKNKESPPAECSNSSFFSSFCLVLSSLAHLSVIWLCSVMFSTHRELSKQEAMMDCLWQKGLVRTSSSDSLAALQWCDTDHFQNQKYNCGVEVLLI